MSGILSHFGLTTHTFTRSEKSNAKQDPVLKRIIALEQGYEEKSQSIIKEPKGSIP